MLCRTQIIPLSRSRTGTRNEGFRSSHSRAQQRTQARRNTRRSQGSHAKRLVPDAAARMTEFVSRGYQVIRYCRPLAGLFADRLKTGDHVLETTYSIGGAGEYGPIETRLFSCMKEAGGCIAQCQNKLGT